jgi:hypothetical protein
MSTARNEAITKVDDPVHGPLARLILCWDPSVYPGPAPAGDGVTCNGRSVDPDGGSQHFVGGPTGTRLVPRPPPLTRLCHSTFNFAVMHNAAFLKRCGRVVPRTEGST